MNPKEVQQRIMAILTARVGGDATSERRMFEELFDDPDLLAAALGTTLFIAGELVGMLADESKISKEEMIRRLALLVAERDDQKPESLD